MNFSKLFEKLDAVFLATSQLPCEQEEERAQQKRSYIKQVCESSMASCQRKEQSLISTLKENQRKEALLAIAAREWKQLVGDVNQWLDRLKEFYESRFDDRDSGTKENLSGRVVASTTNTGSDSCEGCQYFEALHFFLSQFSGIFVSNNMVSSRKEESPIPTSSSSHPLRRLHQRLFHRRTTVIEEEGNADQEEVLKMMRGMYAQDRTWEKSLTAVVSLALPVVRGYTKVVGSECTCKNKKETGQRSEDKEKMATLEEMIGVFLGYVSGLLMGPLSDSSLIEFDSITPLQKHLLSESEAWLDTSSWKELCRFLERSVLETNLEQLIGEKIEGLQEMAVGMGLSNYLGRTRIIGSNDQLSASKVLSPFAVYLQHHNAVRRLLYHFPVTADDGGKELPPVEPATVVQLLPYVKSLSVQLVSTDFELILQNLFGCTRAGEKGEKAGSAGTPPSDFNAVSIGVLPIVCHTLLYLWNAWGRYVQPVFERYYHWLIAVKGTEKEVPRAGSRSPQPQQEDGHRKDDSAAASAFDFLTAVNELVDFSMEYETMMQQSISKVLLSFLGVNISGERCSPKIVSGVQKLSRNLFMYAKSQRHFGCLVPSISILTSQDILVRWLSHAADHILQTSVLSLQLPVQMDEWDGSATNPKHHSLLEGENTDSQGELQDGEGRGVESTLLSFLLGSVDKTTISRSQASSGRKEVLRKLLGRSGAVPPHAVKCGRALHSILLKLECIVTGAEPFFFSDHSSGLSNIKSGKSSFGGESTTEKISKPQPQLPPTVHLARLSVIFDSLVLPPLRRWHQYFRESLGEISQNDLFDASISSSQRSDTLSTEKGQATARKCAYSLCAIVNGSHFFEAKIQEFVQLISHWGGVAGGDTHTPSNPGSTSPYTSISATAVVASLTRVSEDYILTGHHSFRLLLEAASWEQQDEKLSAASYRTSSCSTHASSRNSTCSSCCHSSLLQGAIDIMEELLPLRVRDVWAQQREHR